MYNPSNHSVPECNTLSVMPMEYTLSQNQNVAQLVTLWTDTGLVHISHNIALFLSLSHIFWPLPFWGSTLLFVCLLALLSFCNSSR